MFVDVGEIKELVLDMVVNGWCGLADTVCGFGLFIFIKNTIIISYILINKIVLLYYQNFYLNSIIFDWYK